MKRAVWIFASIILGLGAVTSAQPAEPDPQADGSGAGSAVAAPPQAPPADPSDPYAGGSADVAPAPAEAPAKPRPPDPKVALPELLRIPTGWLLPAAVFYSRTSLDTGGGFASDNRVGLGDVAEFGVATSDMVRFRNNAASRPETIQPYVTATFRLGVAENRLFARQPGIVLGFKKSFERDFRDTTSKIAELTLVASGHLGPRAAYHVGGAFWDAELRGTRTDGTTFDETLHGYNEIWKKQVRAFGGVEVQPLDKSEILVDLSWSPEFCRDCAMNDAIRLRPELSWGVRYEVASYMHLEAGVRVPDIGNANLLDAQIFGQFTFTSWALRHAVDNLK
jgi:hypothetical protein